MAVRTWDGRADPELQADPVETDIPSMSSPIIRVSPPAPSNPIPRVLGRDLPG